MIFDHILDDAALFPPGDAPLDEAVPGHARHAGATYGRCVGAFIAPAAKVSTVARRWERGDYQNRLELAVTFSDGPETLSQAWPATARHEPLDIVAVEVAVSQQIPAADAIRAITEAVPDAIRTYLEVPRDERRPDFLDAMADSRVMAKFRTGGITRASYPDEGELGQAIAQCVTRGLTFKATAGLHHAIRNTDPVTGFEQHGFLNILAAVAAAQDGAALDDLTAILASRDGSALAESVGSLNSDQIDGVRAQFTSFGTCSIIEPIEDLVQLRLLPADMTPTHRGAPE